MFDKLVIPPRHNLYFLLLTFVDINTLGVEFDNDLDGVDGGYPDLARHPLSYSSAPPTSGNKSFSLKYFLDSKMIKSKI